MKPKAGDAGSRVMDPNDPTAVSPELENELGRLDYFLAELVKLRDRGLLSDESHSVIAAEYQAKRTVIQNTGRIAFWLKEANRFRSYYPDRALISAERALEIDPRSEEAIQLAISMKVRLGRLREALDDCRAHRDRIPALDEQAADIEGRIRRIEKAKQPPPLPASPPPAAKPEPIGDIRFVDDQPADAPASEFDLAAETEPLPRPSSEIKPKRPPKPAVPAFNVGDFLLEHWQKLILGLAIVLIVVSSTVGASRVLGPQLWSAEGKSLLALVYTAMFAGLGIGLARWGARRAGEGVLLIALAVLPINFTLAGELGVLADPTARRVGIVLLSIAVLGFMAWILTGLLGVRGRGLFPIGLMVLSVLNLAMVREAGFAWEFAAIQASAVTFLVVVLFCARSWLREQEGGPGQGPGQGPEQADPNRESVAMGLLTPLGVLGYAFGFGLIHSALTTPDVHASLYALPTMAAAIAVVWTGRALRDAGESPSQTALVQFLGLILSAVGFALALSRPPGVSALSGGNTLGVSVLGLILYVTMLRNRRHPSYLYLTCAALLSCWFGAWGFLREAAAVIDQTIAGLLGYTGALPEAYRALNGLSLNLILAMMARWVRVSWGDRRLVWHIHAIGAAIAASACLWCLQETLAALICLSGYSLLLGAGVLAYRRPVLIYPFGLVMAGALGFAGRWLERGQADVGLVWVAIGLAMAWGSVLARGLIGDPFRQATIRVALGLACAAIIAGSLPLAEDPRLAACGPLAAILTLAALIMIAADREWNAAWLRLTAVTSLNAAYVLGGLALLAEPWFRAWVNAPGRIALTMAAAGLAQAAMIGGIKRYGPELKIWSALQAGAAVAYCVRQTPLLNPGLELTRDPASPPIALAVAALAFVVLSLRGLDRRFAYAGALVGSGAFVWGLAAILQETRIAAPQISSLGLACGAAACLCALAIELLGARRSTARPAIRIYRDPLQFSMLLASALSWAAALADPFAYGWNALALALTTLALADSLRSYPTARLALAAVISGFGVWFSLFKLSVGAQVEVRITVLAAAAAGYGVALLGVWAWARFASGPSTTPAPASENVESESRTPAPTLGRRLANVLPAPDVWLRTVPEFASLFWIGAAAAALAPADLRLDGSWRADWAISATFVLIAIGGDLAARIRRWDGMGFASIMAAAIAALAAVPVALGPGTAEWPWLLAWQGLALSAVALTSAAWGLTGRWRGAAAALVRSRWAAAVVLAVPACVLALLAEPTRLTATHPISMAALLTVSAAFAVTAAIRRKPETTYAGIAVFVLASYVLLFYLGRNVQTSDPSALAILAIAEAIAFSMIGYALSRRLPDVWSGIYADPLSRVAVGLAVLGSGLGYDSPWAMLLAAFAFAIFVKPFPSPRWLYATAAALVWALWIQVLEDWPARSQTLGVLAAAVGLWAIGWLIHRRLEWLVAKLRLADLRYNRPFLNAAALGIPFAIYRWFTAILAEGGNRAESLSAALSAQTGILAAAAGLALLLFKAHLDEGWLHLAILLCTAEAAALAFPYVEHPLLWLPVGMTIAVIWLMVHQVLRRFEPRLRTVFGIAEPAPIASPFFQWASLGFGAAAIMTTAFVIISTFQASWGLRWLWVHGPLMGTIISWGGMATAVLLMFVYWDLLRRFHVHNQPWTTNASVLLFWLVATLLVWTVGIPPSPLEWDAKAYLPIATSGLALAATLFAWRLPFIERGDDETRTVWPIGELSRGQAATLKLGFAAISWAMAIVAALLTLLRVRPSTEIALFFAAFAQFVAVFTLRPLSLAPISARLAGALWTLGVVWLGLRWQGPSSANLSLAVAALGLIGLMELTRRVRPPSEDEPEAWKRIARIWGDLALASGVLGLAALPWGWTEPLQSTFGLIALAVVFVAQAERLRSEGLVGLGLACLAGSYLTFRLGYPAPGPTDAIVVLGMGLASCGIAEVMQRIGKTLYVRPTLAAALILPLISLGLGFRETRIDDENLFLTFAVASFYAILAYRLGWRVLGYGAAVLYNVMLWLLWTRIGWTLSDHPQLFVVPVGFSAILFAEANRQDLGRANVNAIRGIGLAMIYLSLAAPILREQSLGAWVALLICSLACIAAGIILRAQTFLWMGLAGFVLDVGLQSFRVGRHDPNWVWAILLIVGLILLFFVAFNEKFGLIKSLRQTYARVRSWD